MFEGDGYLVSTEEPSPENLYLAACYFNEACYNSGIKEFNLKAEEIRDILPLGLKTEIVMTGFEY